MRTTTFIAKNWHSLWAAGAAAIFVLASCAGAPGAGMGGAFSSEPVIVGAGSGWELEGILTMPAGARARAQVPAVVLVHGSGPADMDLTMNQSKPFLDIAQYLSANGIAALRYDKRTHTHGARFIEELGGGATVWEETIEDALLAAAILRADPRVDSNRVFLLGLSLGGMLAPRIQTSGGDFAGLILMAGSPRLLTDILVEQFTASVDAAIAAGISGPELTMAIAQTTAMTAHFAEIPGLTREQAMATPSLGVYAYYYWDLIMNPFADHAMQVRAPMLVMQGSRDFQVLANIDFAIIAEILSGRDNVSFKLYQDLNHLFMPSSATDFNEHGMEIMLSTGNVDPQVLRDIVDWIQAH
ncbi:MAG: alpha/beta fold hydrolase [Treponema sp.]|nr:alpha/beta fold hydrolase [Treponema sp.]